MSASSLPGGDLTELPFAVQRHLDVICEAYESAWQDGGEPRLEDFLVGVGEPERTHLFRELLLLEQELRQVRGLPSRSGVYSDLFPEYRTLVLRLDGQAGAAVAALPDLSGTGYEILGELGRGGMGIVYKARQVRLNRVVALKVLAGLEYADPESVARFRIEGEMLARLQHPNIVQVHEVGTHRGLGFIALEYVEGGSLAQQLRGGKPWPAADAARLVQTLAGAVHSAHLHGVIHRDLKPANVLLTADGTPKIADFGLAKQIDTEGPTRSGEIVGTPRYMAPEQFGGSRRVGPGVDVHALGLILYELLTCRVPFADEDMVGLLSRIRNDPPPSLSSIVKGVPRDLETICLKCLEKDPARRYQSAAELADDLGRFLDREPIKARRISEWERVRMWAKKRPAPAALLGLLTLLAVVGFPGVSYLYWSASVARKTAQDREGDAVLARNEASQQRDRSRMQSAEFQFERGLQLCNQGEVGKGMHWMLEALRTAPAEGNEDFRLIVRGNLASWSQHLIAPERSLDVPTGRAVAWAPDGKTFAVGDDEYTIRFFDAATGRQTGPTIRTPDMVVSGLAFSPDGLRLLSGPGYHFNFPPGPKYVRIWDVATGKPAGPLLKHDNATTWVAWGDDRHVLTQEFAGPARLWDVSRGESITPEAAGLPEGTKVVLCGTSVFVLPDAGETPLAASLQQPTRAFSVRRPAGQLDPDRRAFWMVREIGGVSMRRCRETGVDRDVLQVRRGAHGGFTPDGSGLALICVDGRLLVLSRVGDRLRGGSVWHDVSDRSQVAVSPDGRHLLTNQRLYRLPRALSRLAAQPRDVQPGEPAGQGRLFSAAEFSPDTSRVVLCSGGFAAVCDASTGLPQAVSPFRVRQATFSPDGRLLATHLDGWGRGPHFLDYSVRLWDYQRNEQVGPVLLDGNNVLTTKFSPDGRTLLAGGFYATVRSWDVKAGKPLFGPMRVGATIENDALSVHPAGLYAASGGYMQEKGRLWDLKTGRLVGEPVGGTRFVRFSPDGKSLLCWNGAAARLHEVPSLKPLAPPMSIGAQMRQALFSPDGSQVLLLGLNGTSQLFDAASSKPVGRFTSGTAEMTCAEFSRDGRKLVVGYADGTVRLWDARTGWPLAAPVLHGDSVLAVAFRPDGSFVAVASSGMVRSWSVPVPTSAALDHLEAALEVLTMQRMQAGQTTAILPDEWSSLRQAWHKRGGWPADLFASPPDERSWHDARAQDAEEDGHHAVAAWHLERLARSRSGDWSVHARLARARAGSGDAAGADAADKVAHSTSGQEMRHWYRHQGACAAARGEWAFALDQLDRLQTLGEDHWLLRRERGKILGELGRKDEQQKEWQRAIAGGARGRFLAPLAEQRAEKGHWKQAAELYDRALESGDWSHLIGRAAAVAHLMAGDSAGYRRQCSALLRGLGDETDRWTVHWLPWVSRACVLGPVEAGDLERLERLLRRVLAAIEEARKKPDPSSAALSPEPGPYETALGAVLHRAGKDREALTCFERALGKGLKSDDVGERVFLCLVLGKLGQKERAAGLLQDVRPASSATFWEQTEERRLLEEARRETLGPAKSSR